MSESVKVFRRHALISCNEDSRVFHRFWVRADEEHGIRIIKRHGTQDETFGLKSKFVSQVLHYLINDVYLKSICRILYPRYSVVERSDWEFRLWTDRRLHL